MKLKLSIAAITAALSMGQGLFACADSPYLGSLCVMAANYCPVDTHVAAEGQLLNVQNNTALFSLLGTQYGGDGKTTFAVPDMRGRTPVGAGQGVGLLNIPQGQKRGQEAVSIAITLTPDNLPQHTHVFAPTMGTQSITIPATTAQNTTLAGKVGVMPAIGDTGNNFTPVAGSTYNLAGAKAGGTSAMQGPYSKGPLPTSPAYVSGVTVDASTMTPNIPAKTVGITTMTGGAVGANTTKNTPIAVNVNTISPQLGVKWCIAVSGTYPRRNQ